MTSDNQENQVPQVERQEMQADIACVGFGPAMGGFLTTLSRALMNEDGTPIAESKAMPGMPPQVICYERTDDIGFGVSGVVTKARAIRASFPDLDPSQVPMAAPVKKVRMGINHLNTKGNYWTPVKKKNHEARTQIRMELVKDPVYRVYVHHEDESLFNRLVNFVQGHKTVYSVSLGLSEMLADFKYVGLSRAREREARDPVSLNSVLPVSAMEEYGLEVEDGKKYFKERIPVKMNAERIVEQYQDVIFEARGQSIKATAKKYWETEEGERIVFF